MSKQNDIFTNLNLSIEAVEFSALTINSCKILKIAKLFDLLDTIKNKPEIFTKTFGQKSAEEIRDKFLKQGIEIDQIDFNLEFKKKFRNHKIISDHTIVES